MASLKVRNASADALLGAEIRRRRILAGMSQEKLGEALGITFQQIQKYEKGTNRVSVSALLLIADAIGASAEELVAFLTRETAAADNNEAVVRSPEDLSVTRFARRLNELPAHSRGDTIASLGRILDAIEAERGVIAVVGAAP